MSLSLPAAFNNIRQACEEFRGNLKDHKALQDSLQIVGEALFPTKNPEQSNEKKEASTEDAKAGKRVKKD